MARPFAFAGGTIAAVLVVLAAAKPEPSPLAHAPPGPPPAPPGPLPVEVFMKGENITGWNPTNDTRSYYCFRIPQLLALPSGTYVC